MAIIPRPGSVANAIPRSGFPRSMETRRVELVGPACDLDGDGTPQTCSGVFAGSPLPWRFRARTAPCYGITSPASDSPAQRQLETQTDRRPHSRTRRCAGNDGRESRGPARPGHHHALSETPEESKKRLAESSGAARGQELLFDRMAMAISGKTGTWLWSHALDPKCDGVRENLERSAGMLVEAAKSRFLAFLFDSHWSGLDPATGNVLAGPLDLGFIPAYPIVHVDLDGDGQIDVLGIWARLNGNGEGVACFLNQAVPGAVVRRRGRRVYHPECDARAALGKALSQSPDISRERALYGSQPRRKD